VAAGGRIALLVHGLSGSHDSGYMRRVGRRLLRRGLRVVRMDLRGCGQGTALARRLYHGGCSGDVRAAAAELHRLSPMSPLILVGFSLGGNIALKLAGESGVDPVPGLERVVALAPPIDLERCVALLSRPRNRLYERHFTRRLVRLVRRRHRFFPDQPPVRFPPRVTMRQFDDLYTAPRSGFADALDYYRRAASLPLLSRIAVPTLILTARDDPFIAVESFEGLDLPPPVEVHILSWGGHLGFLGWDGQGGIHWAERRVADWLMLPSPGGPLKDPSQEDADFHPRVVANGRCASRPRHPARPLVWRKSLPFLSPHLACLAAFATGVDARALLLCLLCYLVRMFAITAGYHRYFSHRAYKTSRPFQLAMAVIGCGALQRGPLWWVSRHRYHHRHSDDAEDLHSPRARGLWWSHVGWLLARDHELVVGSAVRDWSRYPELRWLDRYHWIPGIALAILCWWLGGWGGLVWGFFVSTVLLYHATFAVNSLCHRFGRRRYATADDSRNNGLVALLTLGEGWHNNHHHDPGSARQGFSWWEIDVTYSGLRLLSLAGVVWDLRPPRPHAVRTEA
jgi:stearoyl-CoA desaturase (Delta-9 desaturase)